jgi:hypothetical protein
MASLPLTNDRRKCLRRLMDERPELLTVTGRQKLLENAGLTRFARDVDFNSNTTLFNQALARRLQDFRTFNSELALLPLIRTPLEMVEGREEDVAFLNSLLVWNAPAPSPL